MTLQRLLFFGIATFISASSCHAFIITSSSITQSSRLRLPTLVVDGITQQPRSSTFYATIDDWEEGTGAAAAAADDDTSLVINDNNIRPSNLELPPADKFDLETALFCSGLAFDSYIEPASNSSRWERGVRYRRLRLFFLVAIFYFLF